MSGTVALSRQRDCGRRQPWRSNRLAFDPSGVSPHFTSPHGRILKRGLDVVVATGLLLVGVPICAVVALLIKIEDGGPVLFRQRRVGRGGQVFVLRKLRSMRVDAEADHGPQWATDNDQRITRVGRWIRASRIDEIPQAWNVLCGEMSIVGPRPERPEFEALLRSVIPSYEQRHAVRPGITGLAQVSLSSSTTVEEVRRKLEYDLRYLRDFRILLDLWILLRTLKIILVPWSGR